jgi:hypothetical protein
MQALGAMERKAVMPRFLPPQPDLEHLKNEAKALLKAHTRGDASVCDVFRRLNRFAHAADSQILSAEIPLTEAQFALAMAYGFASWEALRKTVLDCQPLEGSEAPPQSGALRLPDPPAAKPGAHRFASAYHLAMSCCGIDCDYDTVAGDSGLAFILQADSLHTAWGAKRKELDIGFWPVAQWGSLLRLDFLGRVYGRKFHAIPENETEYSADEAEHFRKHFQAAIVQSLQQGRPALGLEGSMWVISGFDNGNPPLLGQVACSNVAEVKRLGRYPWSMIVLGEAVDTIDRRQADVEAVEFAVCLHNDRYGPPLPGKTSGKASFALWERQLRDPEMCGPNFYHANVVGQLRQLRASAPPYLRQMASRHSQGAADHLRAAADIYDQVVARLATADTSKAAFASPAGRERLADLVDEVAALDARAVGELALAAKSMGG